MKYNFITIEGNIGSGKTSLAEKIAADMNARLCLESFADNPFLPRFYKSPGRYAFPLELFFLAERYQQLKMLISNRDMFNQSVVSDYHFAKSQLFAGINLNGDEYLLYRRLFNIIYPNIPQPELIIYLHNEVANLLLNIARRGRDYEKGISAGYLENIQQAYLHFFKTLTKQIVLIVNIANLDFVGNEDDYERIAELLLHDYTPGMHFVEV